MAGAVGTVRSAERFSTSRREDTVTDHLRLMFQDSGMEPPQALRWLDEQGLLRLNQDFGPLAPWVFLPVTRVPKKNLARTDYADAQVFAFACRQDNSDRAALVVTEACTESVILMDYMPHREAEVIHRCADVWEFVASIMMRDVAEWQRRSADIQTGRAGRTLLNRNSL